MSNNRTGWYKVTTGREKTSQNITKLLFLTEPGRGDGLENVCYTKRRPQEEIAHDDGERESDGLDAFAIVFGALSLVAVR